MTTFAEFATEVITDKGTREAITSNVMANNTFDKGNDSDVRTLLGIAYENGGTVAGIVQIINSIGKIRGIRILRDIVYDARYLAKVKRRLA